MTLRGLVVLVLACGLVACEPLRDDRVPPFRERPYGAGLETASSGRRVEVRAADRSLVAKYRLSPRSMRVYDELAMLAEEDEHPADVARRLEQSARRASM